MRGQAHCPRLGLTEGETVMILIQGEKLKLTGTLIFFLMIMIFSGFFSGNRCYSSGDSPTLYLEPSHSYIKPGESCTLSVMVDDAVDSLSCVFCVVSFDSSLLDCQLAEEGTLYANAQYTTFFNWELIAPDSVRVEDCVLGYRSYILAPGELYTLVFQGIENGTSPVAISRAEVYDIDRNSLPVTLGAQVKISVSSTAGSNRMIPSAGSFYSYPNPFNPATTLIFHSPVDQEGYMNRRGELLIYAAGGQLVRNLFRGRLRGRRNKFLWNGRNNREINVSAGVYIAVLRTPARIYKRKMILVR